jgi:hypothetical protein
MKLYHKQLNSLDELKLEKQRLKAVLNKTEQEGFISMNDILPLKKEGDNKDLVSQLTGLLDNVGAKELVMSLAGPALGLLGDKIEKHTLKKIAKEFLGSYVKWKAIELGYAGIRALIERNKKKDS